MKTLKNLSVLLLIIGITFGTSSCEKLLDQEPPTSGGVLNPADAIQTPDDLQELLNSAYDVLANTYDGKVQNSINALSDNLIRPINFVDYESVWLRQTTIFNGTIGTAYGQPYIAILRANTVLYNLDAIELTAAEQTRFEAEARFIRALCHFEVVRDYAQPFGYTANNSHPGIAIKEDIAVTSSTRSTVAEVYNFILQDVAYAAQNLPASNGVYATSWSAKALEAEMRFQMHDYQAAYDLANECVEMSPYYFDTEVNKYQFPQASPEALFYIFSATNPQTGAIDNRNGDLRGRYNSQGNPNYRFVEDFYTELTVVGPTLPRAMLYEEFDQEGVITYVTNMLNAESFNIPLTTITQMMLIRAESAAEIGGDLTQAIDDINAIRQRAYNSPIENLLTTATADQVIQAARMERRMEFPCNGQRYHDLKRIGSQGEEVIVRGAPWDCNGMILQFPATQGTENFPLNPTGGC